MITDPPPTATELMSEYRKMSGQKPPLMIDCQSCGRPFVLGTHDLHECMRQHSLIQSIFGGGFELDLVDRVVESWLLRGVVDSCDC